MGDAPKRHDRAKLRHGRNRLHQELPAGVDLGRQRLVLRRHTAHRVADPAIDQLQSIVGAGLIDAFGKAVIEQGRVQQVAGVVAGERASGAVGALHAGREPDDQELCFGIAERIDRRVVPIRLFRARLSAKFGEPRAERAIAAGFERVTDGETNHVSKAFSSESRPTDPDPGSRPGRVDDARQTKNPGSVSIRTEALAAYWRILNRRILHRRRPAAPRWSRAAGIAGSDGAVHAEQGARTGRGPALIAARRGP